MNTLDLFADTCSSWLAVPTVGSLSLQDSGLLARGINRAVGGLFDRVAPEWKRRQWHLELAAPRTQSVVFLSGEGTFTGAVPYQRIELAGRKTWWMPKLDAPTKAIPAWAPPNGTHSVKIYDNAKALPFLVHSIHSLRDVDREWTQIPRPDPFHSCPWENSFWLRTENEPDGERHYLDFHLPEAAASIDLECVWYPRQFGVVDSLDAIETGIPDWLGDLAVAAAGNFLLIHPKFKTEKATIAQAAKDDAFREASNKIPPGMARYARICRPQGY